MTKRVRRKPGIQILWGGGYRPSLWQSEVAYSYRSTTPKVLWCNQASIGGRIDLRSVLCQAVT